MTIWCLEFYGAYPSLVCLFNLHLIPVSRFFSLSLSANSLYFSFFSFSRLSINCLRSFSKSALTCRKLSIFSNLASNYLILSIKDILSISKSFYFNSNNLSRFRMSWYYDVHQCHPFFFWGCCTQTLFFVFLPLILPFLSYEIQSDQPIPLFRHTISFLFLYFPPETVLSLIP